MSMIGLGQQLKGQARQGFGVLANLEQQRNRANDQLELAEEQRTMSNVGTGVGIGMAVGGPMGAVYGGLAGLAFDTIF